MKFRFIGDGRGHAERAYRITTSRAREILCLPADGYVGSPGIDTIRYLPQAHAIYTMPIAGQNGAMSMIAMHGCT